MRQQAKKATYLWHKGGGGKDEGEVCSCVHVCQMLVPYNQCATQWKVGESSWIK